MPEGEAVVCPPREALLDHDRDQRLGRVHADGRAGLLPLGAHHVQPERRRDLQRDLLVGRPPRQQVRDAIGPHGVQILGQGGHDARVDLEARRRRPQHPLRHPLTQQLHHKERVAMAAPRDARGEIGVDGQAASDERLHLVVREGREGEALHLRQRGQLIKQGAHGGHRHQILRAHGQQEEHRALRRRRPPQDEAHEGHGLFAPMRVVEPDQHGPLATHDLQVGAQHAEAVLRGLTAGGRRRRACVAEHHLGQRLEIPAVALPALALGQPRQPGDALLNLDRRQPDALVVPHEHRPDAVRRPALAPVPGPEHLGGADLGGSVAHPLGQPALAGPRGAFEDQRGRAPR